VCCPACWHRFTVDSAGNVVALEVEPLYATPPGASGDGERRSPGNSEPGESFGPVADGPVPPELETALALARQALSDLDPFEPDVREAVSRGRMFAEFGPRILDAFDRYRHAADPAAGPGPFRTALRERWEVDLSDGSAAEIPAGRS
jgi:hypothetical protein